MAIGQRGSNTPTKWLELDGKTGVLTAWNKEERKEEEFGYVAGRVTGVAVRERDYGVKGKGYVVAITLKDDSANERYIIESGAGSRVTTRLLGQLNAADLSQPIYVAPYMMKAGDKLNDGGTVNQDTAMTSVKTVLGVTGDKLELSEGIKAHFGDTYGAKLPAPLPVLKADGSQLMQNGQPVVDRSAIEQLCADLVGAVDAKVKDKAPAQSHGDESIDAAEAASAVAGVEREAMRARG